MKKVLFALMALAGLFSVTSCEKEEQAPSFSVKSAEELISGNKWRITSSYHYNVFADGTVSQGDAYPKFDECDRDDFWQFYTNGTMVVDEGASKCDPDAPQTNPANWTISDDNKTLSIITPNENRLYELLKITSDSLRIRISGVTASNLRYTHTITFRPL